VGLPIKRAVAILEQNNMNLRAGNVANDPTLVLGVRAVGAFRTLKDIQDMTLTVDKNGGRVRLKDIADVKDSYLENESFSRLDAKSAVTVYVQKESMANTVRVAGQSGEVLDSFRDRLPKDVQLVIISDQRRAILSSVEAVRITLIYGVALVVLVLPLFLAKTIGSKALAWVFLILLVIHHDPQFYLFRLPLAGTEGLAALVAVIMLVMALFRPGFAIRSGGGILHPGLCLCHVWRSCIWRASRSTSCPCPALCWASALLVDNAVVVMENYDRLALLENPTADT
jgi:multidrug efflux pump subunit AcrB